MPLPTRGRVDITIEAERHWPMYGNFDIVFNLTPLLFPLAIAPHFAAPCRPPRAPCDKRFRVPVLISGAGCVNIGCWLVLSPHNCQLSPTQFRITINRYVEFVLRWGIGLKHTSRPDLIKLTEYHI